MSENLIDDPRNLDFWHKRIEDAKSTKTIKPAVQAAVYDAHPDLEMKKKEAATVLLAKYAQSGSKILDIGCGYGHLCECIPPGASYLGTDFVPEFIEEAKRLYNDVPNVSFAVLDTRDIVALRGLGDFDLITGRGVFAYLVASPNWNDILQTLQEMSPMVIFFGYLLTEPYEVFSR